MRVLIEINKYNRTKEVGTGILLYIILWYIIVIIIL